MNRYPVISSNVAAIGYDDESQTLEVEFNDGGIYQYFDVPPRVYEEFRNATSPGKYLHNEIKGHYRFARA